MATATPTYAALRNAKYRNKSSHFVDLVQRLNDTINNLNPRARSNWTSSLKKAIQAFKRSYPNVKNYSDRKLFRLCKAHDIPLMDIMIDTTMQREPDLQWILKIITNFRAYQAQPMQVFATPDGRWGAWDSQHTALAMYLIAEHALKLDLTTVMVPANIYDVTSRGDLRHLFISMNTTTGKNAGKKSLEHIDLFEQMIYGVEVDGITEPEWVDAHAKWKYLAAGGMFVTADKFNNTDETGAISRLQEIMEASPEVVRQFSVYGQYVIESQDTPKNPRSINTKEIPIIIEFLNLCEQNQIKYSDAVIEDLAQHCIDLFDANFDAKGPYWVQVHEANVNAYNKAHKGIPKHMWPEAPRNAKNTPQGTAFFWHQLMKTWVPNQAAGFKFPKQPFSVYTPDVKDLY